MLERLNGAILANLKGIICKMEVLLYEAVHAVQPGNKAKPIHPRINPTFALSLIIVSAKFEASHHLIMNDIIALFFYNIFNA
jgi:hypothetical protein